MQLHRHLLVLLALAAGTGCATAEVELLDVDADGFLSDVDCDDADPFVYPGAPEHCNGRDDDCDGQVDGDDASATTLWFVDDDQDGFGDPDTAVRSCAAPEGHIARGEDCDDGDADVFPGQVDGCDGVDSDCDGVVDDNPDERAYLDTDGDGHGGAAIGWGCVGTDATEEPTDCNDDDASIFPGADERCNGVDDDCDGGIDDLDPEGPSDPLLWYADVDLDGYGDPSQTVLACEAPTGNVVAIDGDCDDDDPDTYPEAFEGCEPVDRNCDGQLPDATAWWSAAYPTRIPLEVSSSVDRLEPVLSVTLDVGAAAPKGFDPRSLALVVQDCAGTGAVRLDAEFTDGLGGVFEGALSLPDGDGVGGLHALLDRPLMADEPVPLALYVAGPIASTPGDASASLDALSSSVVSLGFDRVDGGLPDVVADALAVDGTVLEGQVGSAPGPGRLGPRGAAGPLVAGVAFSEVVRASGMVAAVEVRTPYEPVDPADATVEQRVRWVAISGLPTLYGWVTTEVLDAGAVSGLSTLGFGAGAQRDTATATDHGGAYGSWSTELAHVGFGWVQPPSGGLDVVLDGDLVQLEGAELSLPQVTMAGALLVDQRMLAVRAAPGPVSDAEMEEALAPELDVVIGAVEAAP